MKMVRTSVTLVSLVLGLLFYSPKGGAELRKWNKKMQEMGNTFSELLPELSDSKPITPESKKKLEKGAKKLLELAHTINMGPDTTGNPLPPEADPTLRFVSGMFEREVKVAYQALESGQVAYARSALRSVSGYCIACHTRHDGGPDVPGVQLSPNTKNLTAMEKAELLAATRQFDAALDAFEKIAADPKFAKQNQIQWGRAVRHAFALSIRVKRDPDRTMALMNKVLSLPQAPGFYSGNIPAWKKSVLDWKSEKTKKLDSEEALYQEALRLTNAAKQLQSHAFDRSADVLYLRSSAVVHELLTRYPMGKRTAEALLLAGDAYDLLGDRIVSPLPDLFYEACIRNAPHTQISEECFLRYEQNVLFGYSGSAGTFIPDDVQNLVNELRPLAQIKNGK